MRQNCSNAGCLLYESNWSLLKQCNSKVFDGNICGIPTRNSETFWLILEKLIFAFFPFLALPLKLLFNNSLRPFFVFKGKQAHNVGSGGGGWWGLMLWWSNEKIMRTTMLFVVQHQRRLAASWKTGDIKSFTSKKNESIILLVFFPFFLLRPFHFHLMLFQDIGMLFAQQPYERDCSDKTTLWPFDLLWDYHIDLLKSFNLPDARGMLGKWALLWELQLWEFKHESL